MNYLIKLKIWYRGLLSKLYFNKDNSPIRCTQCSSKSKEFITIDTIDYVLCESEVKCGKCGSSLGYWAYGYYDPAYLMDFIGYMDADKETQYYREPNECFGGCDDSTIEPITDFPVI